MAARRYAQGTSVPVDNSRREIERTLERYGASTFGYAWDRREEPYCRRCRALASPSCRSEGEEGHPYSVDREIREYAMLSFKLRDRAIRLDVPMPVAREVGSRASVDARTRERWRAIALVVKAKLEAVNAGISTLEQEFLANVVTDSGMTLGQILIPRMTEAVSAGRLLPEHRP